VARIRRGEVGAVFELEVSRFGRSNADLTRLMELARLTDTLLIEAVSIASTKAREGTAQPSGRRTGRATRPLRSRTRLHQRRTREPSVRIGVRWHTGATDEPTVPRHGPGHTRALQRRAGTDQPP
jgi:hypothetical protein